MGSRTLLFLALFGALLLASEVQADESHEAALPPLAPGWYAPQHEANVALGENAAESDALKDAGETHPSSWLVAACRV
jgi:hypothetical protein